MVNVMVTICYNDIRNYNTFYNDINIKQAGRLKASLIQVLLGLALFCLFNNQENTKKKQINSRPAIY